ncbi:MAG: hypothetical protein AAF570_03190, partial [Bacteroidota bacterium]
VLVAAIFSYTLVFSQASFDEKYTTASNIGLTVTNLGIIGNSFGGSFNLEGFPSCEYPTNSGIEHVFDGGLWVGAKINGGVTAVTTGAIDASSGYTTGRRGFEFSAPAGSRLEERSSLFDSPFFDPNAISHQDFVADFADTAIFVPGTQIQIQNHDNPLDIGVHMESYNWNFPFANFFVILNFRITNIGNNVLEEPYMGFWVDPVIRNINITQPGGSAFFNKGGNGYIDSLYMAYEFDAAGDTFFTQSYFATKFLGAEDKTGFLHPKLDPGFVDHYNTWQFSNSNDPLYFFPQDDNAQYAKMNSGLNHLMPPQQDWETQIKPNIRVASNRTHIVSVGPFPTIMPGETVDVAFALICAKRKEDGVHISADTDVQKENLVQNASWAQTAYNGEDANCNGILDPGEDKDGDGIIDRFILPSPPATPVVRIEPGDNKIDVYWTNESEFSVDPISNQMDFEGYRLYKTAVGFDVKDVVDIAAELKLAAEYDVDSNALFFNTGFASVLLDEPVTFDEDPNEYHYRYTFDNIQNGWQHAISVTAFDTGDEVNNLESLESSPLASMQRVFPGKNGNEGFVNGDPFVYPNPYYAGASWEGASTFEEDRKVMFANLPTECEVRIYTVAGDLVDQFEHTAAYDGGDIRWFETYSDTANTRFSGGEHAWDLLSKDNQIIARGIYLFSVKDLSTGKIFKGKFVVIK